MLYEKPKKDITHLLSKRRVYIAIIFCLIITGFLFWRETSVGDFSYHITWTSRTILFLALGLVMMVFRDLAYIIRIRVLTKKKLTWKQAFNTIMMWEFASALTPGVVGGSAVAIFILQREKITLGRATTLVICSAILDNLFYIILIPSTIFFISSASLFPANSDWLNVGGLTVFWIGYSAILIVNLVLITSVFIQPNIIAFIVRLIYKLPFLKRKQQKGVQLIKDVKKASKSLKKESLKYWISLFCLTIWSWLARFAVINCVLLAFLPLNWFDHLIILVRQLMMWVVMLISPTPGGSGMAELLFTEIYADYVFSIGLSGALLAIIWRIISYYPYLFIGSIILPRWLSRTAN